MNTPDLELILGITETEWLACANPVRLVKRYRERCGGRRYLLLVCAFALDVPQVNLRGLGREIVEAVRNAALTAPRTGWSGSEMHTRLTAAFATRRVDGLPLFAYRGLDPGTLNLIGPGGRVVDEIVRAVFHYGFGWRSANRVSAAVESHLRREAHREVRSEVNRVTRRPPACGPREATLRLLPNEDRAELARVDWPADGRVPGRILRRVQSGATRERLAATRGVMADLAREVLGNPFRPPVIDPAWRLWNHGAVRQIAEQIAASGNFADMPVLADALEEAGCADEHLLRHCREERTHVPGCWALDAVLGRG